ncbi:hypothetical protein JW968_01560 [Candidatus Woesearchaeota archaeon]|nr:hypothetical protein [Candidatus Woesearchaeota archaeon]
MPEIRSFGVLFSTQDAASLNILARLKEMKECIETDEDRFGHRVFHVKGIDNARFYTTDTRPVYCENYDEQMPEDMIIFATKHMSASGIKSLSVHSPGNWGKGDLGGRDKTLCIAPARHLRMALFKLKELAKELPVEIIQECTHHGPEIKKPVMFIEIGSSEEDWGDEQCGKAIAETIIYIISNPVPECKAAFGIGGLHHTPVFTELMHRSDFCFGHVCPKYNLENLDEGMVRQVIDKTSEKVDMIFLDWKGLKDQKDRIIQMLDSMGLEYMKTKEIHKTTETK